MLIHEVIAGLIICQLCENGAPIFVDSREVAAERGGAALRTRAARLTSTEMKRNGSSGLPNGKSSAGLNSAALQAHIAASLGLPTSKPVSVSRSSASKSTVSSGAKPAASTAVKPPAASASSSTSDVLRSAVERIECECGRILGASSSCSCGARARVSKDVKHEPTLAERRGLVAGPEWKPPTDAEWAAIEARTVARLTSFDKYAHDTHCPICLARIGLRSACVTNCLHVFHTSCLSQMERFAAAAHSLPLQQMSTQRACPVCRRIGYHRRETRICAELAIQHSFTLLQALWKRHCARNRYFEIRREHYARADASTVDASRRRAFFAEALHKAGDQLHASVASRQRDVATLLLSSDAAIAASRGVLALADHLIARRAATPSAGSATIQPSLSTGHNSATPYAEEAKAVLHDLARRIAAAQKRQEALAAMRADLIAARASIGARVARLSVQPTSSSSADAVDWDTVAMTAKGRGDDCAICLGQLTAIPSLLSCAHAFHAACITSYETFAVNSAVRAADQAPVHRCPLCRSTYLRVEWAEWTPSEAGDASSGASAAVR
jgi:hypothetical protein